MQHVLQQKPHDGEKFSQQSLTTGVAMGRILPMNGNNYLTAGEVAARALVNRTTVHHWAKDGKLPVAHVVNGIRLFDPELVDRFIAARKAVNA